MIQKLVRSYNCSYHRLIHHLPAEVSSSNQESVWLTLYGDLRSKIPKCGVGTGVRLSVIRRQFTKAQIQGWIQEEFEIAEAFTGDPLYYKIRDLRGEVAEGSFYQPELQKVVKSDDVYKIDSIF